MSDNVIIDTSVWIDYFQNRSQALSKQVDKILSDSEIYVPKLIIAELIQGAHSQREIKVFTDYFNAFHILNEGEDTWFKAGILSYSMRKKGKTINLTDCCIAIMAKENDCAILTLDRHFREIEKSAGIQLVETEK